MCRVLVLSLLVSACGKEPVERLPDPVHVLATVLAEVRPAFPTSNQAIDLEGCRMAGTPKGTGHVSIVFDENGRAKKAEVDDPVFANTHTGWCVAQRYRKMATGVGSAEVTFAF